MDFWSFYYPVYTSLNFFARVHTHTHTHVHRERGRLQTFSIFIRRPYSVSLQSPLSPMKQA